MVFKLDSEIEFDGERYSDLLIRSRWQDCEIDNVEPTSVFILLLDDAANLRDGFSVDSTPPRRLGDGRGDLTRWA